MNEDKQPGSVLYHWLWLLKIADFSLLRAACFFQKLPKKTDFVVKKNKSKKGA